MAYVTNGALGVDLEKHPTMLSNGCNFAEFPLGMRVQASDNQVYVYVKASAAITQYDVVGIDEDYNAAPITHALAKAGYQIGAAQVAFSSGQYGWVAVSGSNISGYVLGSCGPDKALFTTSTAGKLDDACSVSGQRLDGVVTVASNTTAACAAKELMFAIGGAHAENI